MTENKIINVDLEDRDKHPLVSIIVVTYNSSKFVLETLESAKSQTYQNIELLISDDGSTDDTLQICKDWLTQNKDRFVHTELITVEKNTGIPANCNRGIKAANGEWITFIDSDDTVNENYLSCFDNRKLGDISMIFLGMESTRYQFNVFHTKNNRIFTLKEVIDIFDFHPHCTGVCSKIFRNDIIKKDKLRFDQRFSNGEDTLFNVNYFKNIENVFIYFDGVYYYREDVTGSLSKSKYENKSHTLTYFEETNKASLQFEDKNIGAAFLSNAMSRLIDQICDDLNSVEKRVELKKLIKNHPKTIILIRQWHTHYAFDSVLLYLDSIISEKQNLIFLNDYLILHKNPVLKYKTLTKPKSFQRENSIEPVIDKKVLNLVDKRKNVYFLDINSDDFYKNTPFYNDTLMYYDANHLNFYGSEKLAEVQGEKVAELLLKLKKTSK